MKANLKEQQKTNALVSVNTSSMPITLSGDLGGTTLIPGIYNATDALLIKEGDLTLDAQGNENAVWIFQLNSDFSTVGGAGGSVILSGGAKAKNVFWQTDLLVNIGEGTSFKGNILAKLPEPDSDVRVDALPLKYRAVKKNFKSQFEMGWPLYGQRL